MSIVWRVVEIPSFFCWNLCRIYYSTVVCWFLYLYYVLMRRQLLYPILSLMGLLLISPLMVFAHSGEDLLLGLWFYYLIWWIPKTIALWKVFKRAGEAGWKAIIPFYDGYIMFKITWIKNWFWYMIIVCILALFLVLILRYCCDIWEILIDVVAIFSEVFLLIVLMVMHFMFARKYWWGVFASILFAIFYPVGILVLGSWNFKYQGKPDKSIVEA